ncbi:MAG: FAD-binding oxidoreductase [Hyphomonadaceae bacterium]|nr:FAD-binding oxidoreductase [Hyphomonadaceae bacterium]
MSTRFHPSDTLASWGRVVKARHLVARPRFPDEIGELISGFSPDAPGLAVGLRRSYGDSNLNPEGHIIDMTGLDRMISFDRETGLICAEAGVSFSQALQLLAPAGWFLPTSPGTRFVTMGGAVANDIHGKNHHAAGTFGASVTRLKLWRTDGVAQEVGPGDPLFHATVGGLGLTGIIEWVEFRAVRIPSTEVEGEDTPFENVSEYFDIAAEKKDRYEHTMAWVDCATGGSHLGRGILSSANWYQHGGLTAHREEPRRKMPIDAPSFAINSLTVRAFNSIRHELKTMRAGPYRQHYEPFLYPLDAIGGWNRLYGARGFYQYQCVLPPDTARDGVVELLKTIVASGQGSTLAVLKDFGPNPPVGLMSFPREGTTLALDFRNQGEATLKLMADLDQIVASAGGRLYPAKDGRISAALFQSGFPKWQEFREHVDPGLSSAFWRRVSA